MTAGIPFTKMVGAGNDFVVVDAKQVARSLHARWPAVARAMCDRRYGIGADGLLVLEPSRIADIRMRVFNPDGSEARMCGNGARCVARYVRAEEPSKGDGRHVMIQTQAGLVPTVVESNAVSIWISDPRVLELGKAVNVNGTRYALTVLDTGVPHVVLFVDNLEEQDVEPLGRAIRSHKAFQPAGTNVNFVKKLTNKSLAIRTYERGVEHETLACGTGTAAAAIAGLLLRRVSGQVINKAMVAEERMTSALRREYGDASRALPATIADNSSERPNRMIEVQTASGEVLRVKLRVREKHGEEGALQVSNVVLEGSATRVFDGVFSWQEVGRS